MRRAFRTQERLEKREGNALPGADGKVPSSYLTGRTNFYRGTEEGKKKVPLIAPRRRRRGAADRRTTERQRPHRSRIEKGAETRPGMA